MIDIEEALRLVVANLPRKKIETVDFRSALGRILAEDLRANCNIPTFNRSAMDGYALRAADLNKTAAELPIVGEIPAGTTEQLSLPPASVMAIMTGAPVPEGADAVQIIEETQLSADGKYVTFLKGVKTGENIRRKGSESADGSVVLEIGRPVGAADIAVMATFGYSRVKVWRRPSVALFSTGNELVDVDQIPQPGQIRNTNVYSLEAQLRIMGLSGDNLGIARDDREHLRRMLREGLERDVSILTGGVSVGEFDYVKEIFQDLGLEILFERVAMKPGKPTVFAKKGEKIVFGLPGNPVSTLVSFENFVRPALGRICGHEQPELPRILGQLQANMRQIAGRTTFLPARVSMESKGWKIHPLPWKGSGDIIGFSRANATVIFPKEMEYMRKGEEVEAMLLPDYFTRRHWGR